MINGEIIKVICVVGPTASGKTALAVELARQLDGEVVSCDSMQIYRGMDIGTAKPDAAEMGGIRHHMLDIIDPDEAYSVSRYVQDASAAIEDIAARGKNVIIAGGTGLYIDSLVKGLGFSGRQEDDIIRKRLLRLYDRFGGERLHRLLELRDSAAAKRIHPNDKKRVCRALEVSFAGRNISEHDRATSGVPPRYSALWLGLDYSGRELLYSGINRRVDTMLDCGLLDEAEKLYRRYGKAPTAMQAIGYKELIGCIEGGEGLEQAVENLKRATRRYAKRQLTWFRRNSEIHWFYRDTAPWDDILRDSTSCAREFLYNEK